MEVAKQFVVNSSIAGHRGDDEPSKQQAKAESSKTVDPKNRVFNALEKRLGEVLLNRIKEAVLESDATMKHWVLAEYAAIPRKNKEALLTDVYFSVGQTNVKLFPLGKRSSEAELLSQSISLRLLLVVGVETFEAIVSDKQYYNKFLSKMFHKATELAFDWLKNVNGPILLGYLKRVPPPVSEALVASGNPVGILEICARVREILVDVSETELQKINRLDDQTLIELLQELANCKTEQDRAAVLDKYRIAFVLASRGRSQ